MQCADAADTKILMCINSMGMMIKSGKVVEGIMVLARRLWEAVCKRIWHLFGYGEANWHDVAGGGGNVRIEEKKPYG